MSVQTLNKYNHYDSINVMINLKKINGNERGKTAMFANVKFVSCCIFVR